MKIISVLLSFFILAFISFASNSSTMEGDERAKTQVCNTFRLIHAMLQGSEKVFTPPASLSELEGDGENFPKIAEAIELMRGNGESAALFVHAPELVAGVTSTDSRAKSSDFRTMAESAVRVGMKARPQHFSSLEEGPITPDTGVAIFGNFFQEFTLEGALDGWLSCLNSRIAEEKKESDSDSDAACREFVNSIGSFLKQIGSKKDPLDKYVDTDEFQEACKLRKWLKKNHDHKDYDEKHERFIELDERIRAARHNAMDEGGQYMFDLLKRMRPELASLEKMSDFIPHEQKRWETEEREEFENYILTEYEKLDPFEPNRLRSFWKKIESHQYGKLCYKIVCESFEEEYIDNPLHQLVQQIWAVSQLDTIHKKSKEGRSRMPASSVDGTYAPNFGYRMKKSVAYGVWITNPLARASGDVIMDAYHSMVDFAKSIDISIFLERFDKHLNDSEEAIEDIVRNPHKYDDIMIDFELFLLERIFHRPFVEGDGLTIPSELERVAGSRENLFSHASKALKDLKQFSNNMLKLRPSVEEVEDNTSPLGLVFGIGFNGGLFDSPNPSGRDKDEIWLTFSNSGRNEGGYLLLSFLKYVARMSSPSLTSRLPSDLNVTFNKYKSLIKRHVRQEIQRFYRLDDSHWDSYMLRHVKQEKAKLEGFMSQLEQDIPFNYLDSKLQTWVRKASNWYRIPQGVDIKFPEKLNPEEHHIQYSARGLLFDAVVGRSFSREYPPELMPHLFSHWKDELLERMDESKAEIVRAIERLKDVPADLHSEILDLLDQIVGEVHPELKAVWETEIRKQFQKFMKPQVELLEDRINKVKQNIKGLGKTLKGLSKSRSTVSTKMEETNESLRMAEEEKLTHEVEMQQLPASAAQLSREQYKQFRTYFFQKRDVSQCVEPLFAKVLAHDRFFSVFISNKPAVEPLQNQAGSRLQLGNRVPYDVITPCDKNCQHHALGHLYVGDMLCHQSVDHLDHIRQIHGLEGVSDQFISLGLNAN